MSGMALTAGAATHFKGGCRPQQQLHETEEEAEGLEKGSTLLCWAALAAAGGKTASSSQDQSLSLRPPGPGAPSCLLGFSLWLLVAELATSIAKEGPLAPEQSLLGPQ